MPLDSLPNAEILNQGEESAVFRSVCHILVAGWIAAALTVSPVLAAMQCRLCCDSTATIAAATPAPHPACCPQHLGSKSHAEAKLRESRDPCPACPKCESQRLSPAVVSGPSDGKPPLLAILPGRLLPRDAVTELSSVLDFGREIIDRATPPPRVLFCTWLK